MEETGRGDAHTSQPLQIDFANSMEWIKQFILLHFTNVGIF